MLKRPLWFAVGAIAGAAGSGWAQRKVRVQVDRYVPEPVQAGASSALRLVKTKARTAAHAGGASGGEGRGEGRVDTAGVTADLPAVEWHPTDRRRSRISPRRQAG